MKMRLQEIAQAMGICSDVRDEAPVTRVAIDSRTVGPGDVFFCIVGERLDGHQFAAEAVARGARAVVAGRPLDFSVPVMVVRDTTVALGRLARAWRERARGRVVGVTGSAGKTTVKEMLAGVLGRAGVVGKNFRNLNNQIGLPLSILEFCGEEDFWVLEVGVSRPGDMAELGQILAPDAAVLLNVGPCHLEGLHSLDGVAREKSVLVDFVRPEGMVVVNADYPAFLERCAHRVAKTVRFSGTGGDGEYACLDRVADGAVFHYRMRCPEGEHVLSVPVQVHVPENVAAVMALAMEWGLTPDMIVSGLGGYTPVSQRFSVSRVGSWILIDDTYNANPVSMARSIDEARRLAAGRRLVLVLADMRELGTDSAVEHARLGQLVARSGCTHCFFSGDHGEDVRAGLEGYRGLFLSVSNAEEIVPHIASLRHEQGVMLFKGSRSCKMENYYAFIERSWS